MAKVLHCSDVVPNCDYIAKGESEQEVLQQAAEHARTAHNVGEVTPELADKVRSAIRDEAAGRYADAAAGSQREGLGA